MITDLEIQFEQVARSIRKTPRGPRYETRIKPGYRHCPQCEPVPDTLETIPINPEWPIIRPYDPVAKWMKTYREVRAIRCPDDPRFDWGRDDVRFNHSGD